MSRLWILYLLTLENNFFPSVDKSDECLLSIIYTFQFVFIPNRNIVAVVTSPSELRVISAELRRRLLMTKFFTLPEQRLGSTLLAISHKMVCALLTEHLNPRHIYLCWSSFVPLTNNRIAILSKCVNFPSS